MLAWCLMPNHVHAVVELIDGFSLSDIVRSWKSFTARLANARLGQRGQFWHPDYFDRFMRNEEHLAQTVEYVEQNPVKASVVVNKRKKFTITPVPTGLFRITAEQKHGNTAPAIKSKLSGVS